jgi:hypothetical protein
MAKYSARGGMVKGAMQFLSGGGWFKPLYQWSGRSR